MLSPSSPSSLPAHSPLLPSPNPRRDDAPPTVDDPASLSPQPSRKSPPPTKINLDDCKLLFATTANTSNNTSLNPSSAFVFTSSRTLRPSAPINDSSPSVSSVFAPSSAPSSPSVSPPTPHSRHASRPSLSTSQLAKHSQGALDARCTVGPNMRAAGFVPLSHTFTPASQSHTPQDQLTSSPSTTSYPTPSDPPPFPPIMFVRTRSPTWELGWGDAQYQSSNLTARLFSPQAPTSCSVSPSPSVVPSSSANSSHPFSSLFNIFSTPSSVSTSLTSLPSESSLPELDHDSVARELESAVNTVYRLRSRTPPPAPPVDGYPFPLTPPRKHESSESSSPKSSFSGTSFATASEGLLAPKPRLPLDVCAAENPSFPEISSPSPPRSVYSGAHSRSHTAPAAPVTVASSPRVLQVRKLPTPPSFRQTLAVPELPLGSKALTTACQLSLTELCDRSPKAWVSYSDCLGGVPSSVSDSTSMSTHSEISRARSRTYTGDSRRGREEKEKRLDGGRKENVIPFGVLDTDPSPTPLSHSKTGYEVVNSGVEDMLYAALALQDEQILWEKERQRTKFGKSGEEQLDSKDRDRHLSTIQHGYSSFSFPPNRRRNSTAMPHRLGERDPDCDYEEQKKLAFAQVYLEHEREQKHYREKMARGIGALVQMHRDRDREQARLSEREHCLHPGADKVKAGNDDEVDVVSELEKDWEKSQSQHRKRSHHQDRRRPNMESSTATELPPLLPTDTLPSLKSLQAS
ncbi:hypothetical protein EIP91_003254 [Steccherinum ochraceum]|uniref:Uncharacterized protein n=1 Tax=Steccherinum ochraceum TaxID=92696 RepID=A0A4R0RT34_9APHY|nr:hypothetical protein EIP91_003254 [Steccherinum ochraceum]